MSIGKEEPTYAFPDLRGEDRLRELILYIADKCADDKYFGAVKLNKILWHADMHAYAHYGVPVTGLEYMRLDHGPAPRRLLPVKEAMLEKGEIVEQPRQLGRRTQKRIIPLREPNLEIFSGKDIAAVDAVIEFLWDKTADDVSEMSHWRAWRITPPGELIPYEAAFLSDEGITEYDKIRAAELIGKYGWDA